MYDSQIHIQPNSKLRKFHEDECTLFGEVEWRGETKEINAKNDIGNQSVGIFDVYVNKTHTFVFDESNMCVALVCLHGYETIDYWLYWDKTIQWS